MTQTAVLYPSNVKGVQNHYLLQLYQVLGGALFIALCSQIKIQLLFTPVPISLQTLAVMITGGMLGRKNGAYSAITYLVFLSMGTSALSSPFPLIGCTGGYLLGFVPQAYLVGWFLEREKEYHSGRVLSVILLTWLMLLVMGTAWLGFFVGWDKAMFLGFYPFLPGGALKCIAAAAFLKKYRRI